MNWVGGSRNRFVMRNDAKKQREFFERRKMQQKLKNMGVPLPASPQGTSSGSMDLVTLFIVNQIASKKENKDPPKVAVLSSSTGGVRNRGNEPLVLPMSPCSPSRLSLVESQPQSSIPSVQGARKRKQCIPQGFRCRQLSPVQESAFSDNSAPDYLPPIVDPHSPFSSTSSTSSGQGIFPLQLDFHQRGQTQSQPPPHCSSSPWDTRRLEQAKFWPFSQPRGMTDRTSWSCGSNPPFYQLDTPTAAQVLFGSPGPDDTEARGRARHEATFSLNLAEDNEPVLDFILNQTETEEQFEEEVFCGFSNKESDGEASHDGRVKSRIYLKAETPYGSSRPLTVPDSQFSGAELSKCTETKSSCPEHNSGSMGAHEYPPSYSCRESYLSSDSSTDEECCQPYLNAACLIKDQARHGDAPNQGSQENAKQSYVQLTPYIESQISPRRDQRRVENMARPDKACASPDKQAGSGAPQPPSHSLPQSDSSELCKRERTSSGTQEAGTQTADIPARQSRDASTQCSLISDSATKTHKLNVHLPPVDHTVLHSTTRRRADSRDAAAEPNPHRAPTSSLRSGGKQSPPTKEYSSIVNKQPADKSDSRAIQNKPMNCFLDGLCVADGRGLSERGRDERAQQGDVPVMKAHSDEERKEVTSGSRVNALSKEADTLQEIADILLTLKQRKREE